MAVSYTHLDVYKRQAPFSAVGIHVADLCRYVGKDPLRSDTDYLPYPRSLHLWVGSDAFRLLGGNILKGAVCIAAYLSLIHI